MPTTIYVVQTIRCATGSPIIGAFSSAALRNAFIDKQPIATRSHLTTTEVIMNVESASLLEFKAPEADPAAEGKAPTETK